MPDLDPTQPPMPGTSPGTGTIDETDVTNLLGKPHNVILFNDDVHAFEEVIIQIIAAVKCSPSKASAIALEAHEKGRAIAFSGHLERCEAVESILAGPPLKLGTKIENA